MQIGVLFDWDGVVIDSSSMHERSWELLAQEEALALPEGHFKKGFGKVNRSIIPDILKWTDDPKEIERLGERKEVLYREIVAREGLKPLPGVADLLKSLHEEGISCAVGSSTPLKNLEAVLDVLGFRRYFKALLSGDDVTHGKPHPEVFLKGAEAIGLEPERCIVFEDAVHGIEAGKAGGMKVVACATTHAREGLGQADWVVDTLEEVSVERLRELLKA